MMSVAIGPKCIAGRLAMLTLVIGVVCFAGCRERRSESGQTQPVASGTAEAREFAIEGMTCEGCVDTVKSALEAIPGVKSADVSLKEKKATVVADAAQVPSSKIEAAVVEAGYKARLLAAGEQSAASTK